MSEHDMKCQDIKYMEMAIAEAEKAAAEGEVPVGAVIVKNGVVIASAHNRTEKEKNATRHAEMSAIDIASRLLGGWRLTGCTIYVTLEPCPMCAGALVNARIGRIVFGAKDLRAGAFGSVIDLNDFVLCSKPEVTGEICKDRCVALLGDFFKQRRKSNK